LPLEQRCEGAELQVAQAAALARKPLGKCFLFDIQPIEELTAAERHRLFECPCRVRIDQAFVGMYVASNDRRIKRERQSVRQHWERAQGTEGKAEPVKRLLETVMRLFVRSIAPEQAAKTITRLGLPSRHGEIGQQRALLAPRQADLPPGYACLEFAE